jgi:Domain of unknown function (DUF4440)
MRYMVLVFLSLSVGASIGCTQNSQNVDRTAAQNEIVANEKAIMDAVVTNDPKTFHSYVAADSFAMTDNGPLKVADFDKMMEQQKAECTFTDAGLTGSTFYWVNDGAVVHMYKATTRATCQGQALPQSWSSTVWTNRGRKWVATFHQETSAAAAVPASANK